MGRPSTFAVLLTFTFILVLPAFVWASRTSNAVPYTLKNKVSFLTDTAKHQQQDEKKDKNTERAEPKQEPEKPDIRAVPKARKQSRPPVVKPNIKGKSIKVIRPKIKRP